jgi:restriction system protein
MEGAAAYNRCLQNQLEAWSSGPRRPDLSQLSPEEKRSAESACTHARLMEGAAANNRCLRDQLRLLGINDTVPSKTASEEANGESQTQTSSKANVSVTNHPAVSSASPTEPYVRRDLSKDRADEVNRTAENRLSPTPNAPASPVETLSDNHQPSSVPKKSEYWSTGNVITLLVLAGGWIWIIAKILPKKAKCPRCRSAVPSEGDFCSLCKAQIQEEVEKQRLAQEESQRAYQQQKAEEARRREEQRQAAERREEERRRRLRTLEGLQQLSGKEFEALIASLFRNDGYTVRECGGSGDEGIDLILQISGAKDVVQCKRWKSDIGSPIVREFYGSLMHANARHGFVITTALYSDSARAFARGKPITLISGPEIIRWMDRAYSARGSAESSDRETRRKQEARSTTSTTDSFDPYATLGVKRGAGPDEIHAAYRREMSNYHPDKVAHLGSDLQELAKRRAQAINRAYGELLGQK